MRRVVWGVVLVGLAGCRESGAAPPAAAGGTIAYARGGELRVIEPDGSGDRLVWAAPPVGSPGLSYHVTGPAWSPDGAELAFASDHEAALSPYATDIWAVRADGSGLRKLTHAPAHAELAKLPRGTVTVMVQPMTAGPFFVIVEGAAEPQQVTAGRRLTFKDVADLGDGVQEVVATNGADRWLGTPVDVKAGKTVDAGLLSMSAMGGVPGYGASGPFWRADRKAVGYFGPQCATARVGVDGKPGAAAPLLARELGGLCGAEWGPTPATANLLVLATMAFDTDGRSLVYVAPEGATKLPAPILALDRYRRVTDLHWLASGKGFVIARQDDLTDEDMNLHEVEVPSGRTRPMTAFAFEGGEKLRRFAISPEGKTIVFERTADLLHGRSDLWIAAGDGSRPRKLVADAGFPAWNPRR